MANPHLTTGRVTAIRRILCPVDFSDHSRRALDPRVPQDVRVHVDRGTVTLTGTVRWPHERSAAEGVVRPH